MKIKALIMDEKAVNRAVVRITHEIIEKNRGVDNLVLVGIKTKGWPMAMKIKDMSREIEGVEVPAFPLDVTFYRDDCGKPNPEVQNDNEVIIDVENKTVILIDDVLYTGRTVRAALDAIVDYGRPSNVRLAVLIDRGHRELPIRADFIGKNLPTSRDEKGLVSFGEGEVEAKVVIAE